MTGDVNQLQSGINMALRLFLRSPFIVFGRHDHGVFHRPALGGGVRGGDSHSQRGGIRRYALLYAPL